MIQSNLEVIFETYPELVAEAKEQWQKATLDREIVESALYMKFKHLDLDRSATELKHLVNADPLRRDAVLVENSFERQYNAKYETLLCAKKDASLRTAY